MRLGLLLPCCSSLLVLASIACTPIDPSLNQLGGDDTANPERSDADTDGSSASLPPMTNGAPASNPVTDGGGGGSTTDSSTTSTDSGSTTVDSSTPGTTPTGQPCTTDAQCTGKLCLPYKDKGPRCTQTCTKDSDCPNNKNCNDNPQVCDI